MQRAAAGALRTLAFKNEENKNLIVECQALPTLIQMLRSDDVGIHYEAVGVIGNLVHSSQHIKKTVLDVRLSPNLTLALYKTVTAPACRPLDRVLCLSCVVSSARCISKKIRIH